MTPFAKQIEALPKMPKTLADVPDGSFGGLLYTQRNALEARLRLAVELLEEFTNADVNTLRQYEELLVPPNLRADARALVEKVRKELP